MKRVYIGVPDIPTALAVFTAPEPALLEPALELEPPLELELDPALALGLPPLLVPLGSDGISLSFNAPDVQATVMASKGARERAKYFPDPGSCFLFTVAPSFRTDLFDLH